MPGRLFVVATPIGNLQDITLRALDTLKSVALIAAEDTRRTATLLRHFGINTPTTSFHTHNERQKFPHLLAKLTEGHDIALVSDAGTPLVADPGQRLIAEAIKAGAAIVPIPGASAVLAALAVSGVPADDFVFAGFAPSRSNDRTKWLAKLAADPRVTVFFEAPHRIAKTLAAMADIFGTRPITICRELTKLHEQVVRTTAARAIELRLPEKGEFTVVVGRKESADAAPELVADKTIYDYFYHLTNIDGLGRRPALSQTGQHFGLSTNIVYSAIERIKNSATS